MAGETTGALITAGAGLMAAGGSTITMGAMGKRARKVAREALADQRNQFKKTLEFNERQAKLNRQFVEDYYNKYDSPEAMVRQYREAGLNPFSYGGQTGSMSSSMGNQPYADPAAAQKPYDNLKEIANSYQQQGQQQAAVVQDAVSTIMQNIDAVENVKSKRLDNERKDIENQQLKHGNDIFNTPLDEVDYSDMSNLPPEWRDSIIKKFGREPTFGDLLYQSMYKQGFRRLYESGSGLGSPDQQSPIARALAAFYARHPSFDTYHNGMSTDGTDDNKHRDWGQKVYDKAFDVFWKELLADENRHEFDAWKNDWDKRLRSKGINPDGNDLLNTAVRLVYGNGGEEFVNDLSSVLGDMFNGADKGVKLLRKLYKTPYQKK